MTGAERRKKILTLIRESTDPVSGAQLADILGVSRQIIVQDIALLRAGDEEIFSTHRGYVCRKQKRVSKAFFVSHSDEDTLDELNTIVDEGGTVLDVFVDHKIYGRLRAELNIRSRSQAALFYETIKSGTSTPLKNITSGMHYHTVEADSEAELKQIETALFQKGYLIIK